MYLQFFVFLQPYLSSQSTSIELKILRKIGISIEYISPLRVKTHFDIGRCLENLLMTSVYRVLLQECLLMPR